MKSILISTAIYCSIAVSLATQGHNGAGELDGAMKEADEYTSGEDVLNMCIDGKHHKSSPGPEGELYQKCSPWKDRACCTNATAYESHQDGADGLYNFNYNHCEKEMSKNCRDRFQENNCFYECSPNIGPWIVQEGNSYRNERYRDVPICQSTCSSWWEDCRNDTTCKSNWATGWDWTSGVNECPTGTECKLFSEIFPTPADLCNVFPGDYKMVSEQQGVPCMVLWFNGENPNDEVTRYYAEEMGLCCGTIIIRSSSAFLLFLAVIAYCLRI